MYYTPENLCITNYTEAINDTYAKFENITVSDIERVCLAIAPTPMYLKSICLPAPKITSDVSHDLIILRASGYSQNRKVTAESCVSYTKNTLSEQLKEALVKVLGTYYAKVFAIENAVLLTSHVHRVLIQNDIDLRLDFSLGDNLIFGLSDEHLGINLDLSVLLRLNRLIGTQSQYSQEFIDSEIVKTFSALPCVLEAVRRRTVFSLQLGFYSRKSAKTLLRQSYHTKYTNCHNGVGYYMDSNICALVEVRSCTASEVEEMSKGYSQVFRCPNTSPKSSDYKIAHSEQELEKYKTWFKNKYPNDEYKIEKRDDNTYLFIYRLYLACAYIFGPVNIKTYSKEMKTSLSKLLGGDS